MIPVWLIVTGLIVIGFFLLLLFNGRKREAEQLAPQPVRRSIVTEVESEAEGASTEKPPQAASYQPAAQQTSIEEATYVEASDEAVGGDFYSEVADLFTKALAEHPERLDLRAKLLDVYFDSGNKEEFVRHAVAYHSSMDKRNDLSWPKIFDMGCSLAPEHELFGGKASSDAAINKQAPKAGKSDGPKYKRFGDAEEAKQPLEELSTAYKELRGTSQYFNLLDLELLRTAGRPAHLMHAKELSAQLGGAQIFIKREDQNGKYPRLRTHLMGQACIAKRLGKEKLIFAARTGEEGVIAAQAAARLSLACQIYISADDGKYRESHKFQAQLMGAEFIETKAGDESGDIRYAGLNAWLLSPESSFMMLNLDAGPHPYPTIANDLQAVIGRETMRQVKGKLGKLPRAVFARGGHNADAIGFVEPFIARRDIGIYLVSGKDEDVYPEHSGGSSKDLYSLLYSTRQKQSANSLLDDLEFPRVDRELNLLKATGRMEYTQVAVSEAKAIVKTMAQAEGVIFPMESAHVLAYACTLAKQYPKDEAVVVMLAEHLDKDMLAVTTEMF